MNRGACPDPQLNSALQYALERPGKQLRSRLCREVARVFSGQSVPASESVGQAIELLHTYSLIHDDLPAMDNDDMRRGRATVHRVYDEATAILVGDGLQALAFEKLASIDSIDAQTRSELIRLIASAVGFQGMVGGQAMDIAAEHESLDLASLKQVHMLKTGALIKAAILAGALCGGAEASALKLLQKFAADIGLAFQITDDILDATASTKVLGKTPGKDLTSFKSTYVACLGVEQATREAETLLKRAISTLELIEADTTTLVDLAKQMVHRTF